VAVLVTRPDPDNAATVAALRAKGFDAVLAPMLRFETVAFDDEPDANYAGVIVTSANALRAIADHPIKPRLLALPLFTVGEHTAEMARAAGFTDVVIAERPDRRGAAALPALIEARLRGKRRGARAAGKPLAHPPLNLIYLAGADITRDLTAELAARGFNLVTRTVYRMVPVRALPTPARQAFAADGVEAILHYSRRSARAFVAAARGEGVEISALALPQCCLSDAVAEVMREAGAARVIVARSPDEDAMIEAVARATRASQSSSARGTC
jgi:uroporphyrinogen-III synthase